MTTLQVIEKQLKENTGSYMLDSGEAYGRHWQHNQKVDFAKEPELKFSFEKDNDGSWWLDVSLSVYHFINAFCEFDEDLSVQMDTWAELPENEKENWFFIAEEFPKTLEDVNYHGVTNTYNFDNILSQILQYSHFEYNKKNYIALQVHGGCDARGGYSKPKIYEVKEFDYFLMAMTHLSIGCKNCHIWDSDDCGYNLHAGNNEPRLTPKTKLRIVKDKAYCPVCNKQLEVWANLEY